jgi:hypothetical protein
VEIFPGSLVSKYAADIFSIIQNYHIDFKFKIYILFLPKLSRNLANIAAQAEICNLVWESLA